MRLLIPLATALLTGCAGHRAGPPTVPAVDLDRYLGRWYELVRYDHGFERGLERVAADYTRRPDGRIAVVNQGWDPRRSRWKRATGVATVDRPGGGDLTVTFFWPFSGAYRIVTLDPDYRWAVVTGPTDGWLWILHRDRTPPAAELEALIAHAESLGFRRERMLIVAQDGDAAPP
jgi:apolipoprotein D and lipocalin family protein